MSRRNNPAKANGHAGPQDRPNGGGPSLSGVNGHGPASTELGGMPEQHDRAVSNEVSGAIVAAGATSSSALDTVRQTCTAVAQPGAQMATADSGSTKDEIPGGEFPLPDHTGDFVDEIHRRIDLFAVWEKLLKSKDEKIKQRAVEKLAEMRYKGAAALADEPQQIVIDIDSAVARRAAQGARK